MFCCCCPRYSDNRTYFHWPNFSFSHSEQRLRLIHSTFGSLNRPKSKRELRRRHTLHSCRIHHTDRVAKRRLSRKSLRSHKTAPAKTISTRAMSSQDYSPPPGPPPSHRVAFQAAQAEQPITPGRSSELQSSNPWRNAHNTTSQEPPQYSSQQESSTNEEYAPPPGPPPSHQQSKEPEPPPYDPWLAVPDNAFLPPPPGFHEDRSPTSNASEEDAERATIWCNRNPLWTPRRHNPEVLSRISQGKVTLTAPPQTKHVHTMRSGAGRTKIKSDPKCKDTIFLSDLPLHTATTGTSKTIYFEVKIVSIGPERSLLRSNDADAALAIGYVAPPYPSWRQPGWHRGSLGVHSDDGHRYVDDPYGGQDFTRPFKKGDVLGLGMSFSPPQYANADARNKVEVFFTRNGKRDGGWDLNEEKDKAQDGGDVFGLQGERDLLAAVGVFGAVEFEVRFRMDNWLFRP